MDPWDLLQWPAMAVNVYAAWLVTSRDKRRRQAGFLWFLVSNVLWSAWGVAAAAYAVLLLQCCLAVLNVIGMRKNAAAS